MTQGSFAAFSKVLLASAFLMSLYTSLSAEAKAPATAPAETKPVTASRAPAVIASSLMTDSAEICTSSDGHYTALRGFGETDTTFVVRSADPSQKPIVKEHFTIVKDTAGAVQKNIVSLEFFELMAEPFGSTSKTKDQWKTAYEGRFDGKVTVISDAGKTLGVISMSCHSAMVDYR